MTQLAMLLRHAKRSNAKEVDLSGRGLQFIPKEVYAIIGIQILNLSDNKISHVDSQIKLLKNLSTLNLANNLLMDLPKELISLKKLQVMIVHGNPLSEKYSKLLTIKPEQDLNECLKQCLPSSGTQSVIDTPSWLKESQHEVKVIDIQKQQLGKGLNWEQNRYPKQSRRMPRTQMKQPEKKISVLQQLSTQNIAKEGVLEIKLNQLQIGQQISMGGFSTIHEGSYFGLEVAIKKVFNPNINEQLMAEFNNQIKMLSKYRHPNIVLLIGAVTIPPALCIAMEYIKQGTLFDLLHRKKIQLDDKQKSRIARQLISVLQYLHSHGIVHRDIKSHNILIDNNKSIKICDFGLAKHKSELNTGPMQFSGTPTYMAQQLFLKKAYDESVDIFALGTLIYQLYSGEIPYAGLDPTDIKEKVLKDSSFSNKLKVKKPVLQIVNRCRSIQVKQRPSIKQLAKFVDW